MPPAVTVSIPIYNAERYLAECLQSIKAQTFDNFEVVAVLDGCKDKSEEILMDLKDERFRVVKNERNMGVISGLNQGIQHATAPLLARMDSDDIMLPDRLRKQVDYMNAHQDVALLGTWFDYMDETGRIFKKPFPFSAEHDAIKREFRVRNCIGGPTMMFRTEQLRKMGGYIPDFPMAEDLTISLRYLVEGLRLANLPEVLVHYRFYAASNSQARMKYSNDLSKLSYDRYGPLIWGKDAPDIDFNATLGQRIVRKFKRVLHGKW
ncbi:MAG TPA: glycosyltransferase [bacterium]|jgi:glycosyltransferase involved in cell wall biosynthesis